MRSTEDGLEPLAQRLEPGKTWLLVLVLSCVMTSYGSNARMHACPTLAGPEVQVTCPAGAYCNVVVGVNVHQGTPRCRFQPLHLLYVATGCKGSLRSSLFFSLSSGFDDGSVGCLAEGMGTCKLPQPKGQSDVSCGHPL